MAASRLSRRRLLQSVGLMTGAIAATAASPTKLNRLLDTRSAVAADGPRLALVRSRAVDGRRAAVLASLDDTHRQAADGSRELLLWPGDESRLLDAGIPYEVVDGDLLADRRIASGTPIPAQPGQRDDYRFWEDFEADLRALVDANPTRARLLELPTPSLLGRTVYGIEIATDVERYDGRPVVHMDGMHHAREWPAAEMPIMWAHDLLESYGSDPQITRIVDRARTVIVPNINPDGFIRSREAAIQVDGSTDVAGAGQLALGAAGRQSYWRKNLRTYSNVNQTVVPVQGSRVDNVDAHGIDLNRNYPFLWGDDEGSSSTTEDQTYRGTDPYSEPEPRNIRELFLRHAPITAITHHTSGQLMLYAWGRDPVAVRSPDWQLMQDLGERMALSNGYQPQQAFRLYPTSGTSRDWGHSVTSTLIYTFEHGTEFHGPYQDTIPEMYAVNRGAFVELSNAAIDPATHLIIRGKITRRGGPLDRATVRLQKYLTTPTADGREIPEIVDTRLDVGRSGRFELHAPPSTRPHLAEERFGGPRTEAWDLVVDVPGREPTTIPVTGGRGDTADLGTIVV